MRSPAAITSRMGPVVAVGLLWVETKVVDLRAMVIGNVAYLLVSAGTTGAYGSVRVRELRRASAAGATIGWHLLRGGSGGARLARTHAAGLSRWR